MKHKLVLLLLIILFCIRTGYTQTNRGYIDFQHLVTRESNLHRLGGGLLGNISGSTCWRTTGLWTSLYFNVLNSLATNQINDHKTYALYIEYYDRTNNCGNDPRLVLHYDDETPGYNEISINMFNTLRWTNHTYYLDDAYFGNRVVYDGFSSDFVLKSSSPLYVRYIKLLGITNLPLTNTTAYLDFQHTVPDGTNLYHLGDGSLTNNVSGYTCYHSLGPWGNFYFDIDNNFAYKQTNDNLTFAITVVYFNTTAGNVAGGHLVLHYDAEANGTNAIDLPMGNTGQWVTYTFYLPDAYFGNRIAYGGHNSDFVLKADSRLNIRRLTVRKGSSAVNKVRLIADTEMGVGTLNKVLIQALDGVDGIASSYNGSVNISLSGSAVLYPDQSSVQLAAGQGKFYISDGQKEQVTITADSSTLQDDTEQVNFIWLYGLNRSRSVDVRLKAVNEQNGLYVVNNADTVVETKDGVECRRSQLGYWTGIMFNIDDSLVFERDIRDGYLYEVKIDYFDEFYNNDASAAEVKCFYDDLDNPVSSPETELPEKLNKTGENRWKSFTYHLSDCYFGNRLFSGVMDFWIKSRWPVYLSKVRVSKKNHISFSPNEALSVESEGVKLTADEKTFSDDGYLITYKMTSLPASLKEKTEPSLVDNYKFINGVDFIAFDKNGNKLPHIFLNKTARLSLSYKGVKDIDIKKIAMFYYNEEKKKWEKAGGKIDTVEKTVSIDIYKMSKYALFEAVSGKGFSAQWTQNPFSPNGDGHLDKTILQLVLPDLSDRIRVLIYNINGQFVRELPKEENSSGQNFIWDGKDYNDKIVPIGPYIYQIKYGEEGYNGIIVVSK